MNPVGAIVIYVLVWWCVFFALLPVGVESRWEGDDDGVDGADPGAPADPKLKKKALWATIASAPISLIIIGIMLSGLINFRD